MVKRKKRIKYIVCLITVLNLSFSLMAEARSVPLFVFVNSGMMKDFHVFKDMKRHPAPVFFWNLHKQISRIDVGLSEIQKTQLQKEFWKLFIDLLACEQKVFSIHQVEPDEYESGPGIRRKIVSPERARGQIIAGHRKIFDGILTPEQHKILHKHKNQEDMLAAFHVPEVLPTSTLTLDALDYAINLNS